MVRPGECIDLYYYDAETSKKQCFPTSVNTKYVQNFTNLGGGSSVFTIPPTNGIQDIVCQFVMPALTGSPTAAGLALPRGWGYALIKQVSFRYGGSSQYFLTGAQILQNALRRQPSRQTADDVLTLGGNVAVGTASWTAAQSANVVLTLPHNVPSAFGKSHPLPTDLLTQQVQITVELYPISQVVSVGNGSSAADVLPTSLTSAQFLVQQVMLNNQGDALARRVDMATNAYAFPCEFVQQAQQIPLAAGTGLQSVVLTGFRSGEVKSLQCWLNRTSDSPQTAQTQATGAINNPFNWQLPLQVIMTYAGDQYARYENQCSPLLNLINDTKAPVVDNAVLSAANVATTSALSYWVELPFAQTDKDEDSHHTLVHGKPITNGIINLQIQPPSSQADWVLTVSYVYNATLLFSQGTCDYVF
jgi:hypothetical protein